MKSSKKAFTLVELIIVIAIIAILAVTAFLMLTKWISKSRDSSRLSDINTIDNALQVYLTEKSSLPKPENYTLIYASGTSNIVGYQGDFTDNTAKSLGNLSKAPKDALDNTYYNYYVDSTSTKYQLLGYTEQTASISNTANAVDYSSRYIRIAGDKLGILTDANNASVNKLGLTGLDIALTTGTYKAYFDSNTSVSGTGSSLVSMMTLNNKNLASLDTGLVFYSDMETTINSGGVVMIKDLSKNGYNLTCGSDWIYGLPPSYTGTNCDAYISNNGKIGKSFNFQNNIVAFSQSLSFPITGGTYSFRINSSYNNTSCPFNIIGAYNIHLRSYSTGFQFQNDGNPQISSNISINSNNWYNVVFVLMNDGTKNLYINGNYIGNGGVYTNSPVFSMLLFGGLRRAGMSNYFNGLIDEVRIYNRTLSNDEVKILYNAN